MAKGAALTKLPLHIHLRGAAEDFCICAILFFLGRTALFGTLAPFGLAFVMAYRSLGYRLGGVQAAAVLAGALSSGDYAMTGVYLASLSGTYFFYRRLNRLLRQFFSVSLFAFFFVVAGGSLVSYARGNELYGQAVAWFNGVLFLLTARLFAYGIGAAKEHGLRYEEEKDEIFICLLLIFALAVVGMTEIGWHSYSLAAMAGSLGIMAAALSGGVSFGAAAGVVIGAMMVFGDKDVAELITLYAISGICGGALRDLGRSGVAVGFACGSLLIGLWYIPLDLYSTHIVELLLSVGLFFLAPLGKIDKVIHAKPATKTVAALENCPYKLYNKLQALADVFWELGRISEESRPPQYTADLQDIDRRISETVKPLCMECENYESCWERYGFQTYQCMLAFFAEAKEKVNLMLPIGECAHSAEIRQSIERANFGKNNVDLLPALFHEQMKSLGGIIQNIANHMEDTNEREQKLIARLEEQCKKLRCPLDKVELFGSGNARCLRITKSVCKENLECLVRLKPIAEEIFGCDFSVKKRCANYPLQKKCFIVLESKHLYHAEVGWATVSKDEFAECGDMVSDIKLPDGRLAVCLSDGMGSGAEAAEESRLVQNILRKLLANDFGIDLTMQLLNILLLINSCRESFAAVDLAVLNLADGKVKFLKAAAAPSYIKRVREIKQIEVASLPAGIVGSDMGESGCLELQLAENDYLIMISDGIEEMKNLKYTPSDREGWLTKYLRHMETISPEQMARNILTEAMKLCAGKPSDDLSAAVVLLQKNKK